MMISIMRGAVCAKSNPCSEESQRQIKPSNEDLMKMTAMSMSKLSARAFCCTASVSTATIFSRHMDWCFLAMAMTASFCSVCSHFKKNAVEFIVKLVVLQALEKARQGQAEAWPGLFVIIV